MEEKPDIVIRLRDDYQKTVALCAGAADEIERLRDELHETKNDLDNQVRSCRCLAY